MRTASQTYGRWDCTKSTERKSIFSHFISPTRQPPAIASTIDELSIKIMNNFMGLLMWNAQVSKNVCIYNWELARTRKRLTSGYGRHLYSLSGGRLAWERIGVILNWHLYKGDGNTGLVKSFKIKRKNAFIYLRSLIKKKGYCTCLS